MPFSLTNAPAAFQGLINDVLRECLDRFANAYLDDIVIYSETLEEHIRHVYDVLTRLQTARLYLKPEKCQFHHAEIEFLGFIIGHGGMCMDPAKVEAITLWPALRRLVELQAFLGFINFYRRFIEGYSREAEGMTRLLKKDIRFHWNKDAEDFFTTLKITFLTIGFLAHHDPTRLATIESDASDNALRGCLSQLDPITEVLCPIAFYSRKLIPTELNYEIYDKEMLAIVECLKQWCVYLEGAQEQTIVLTNHKNLE